MPRGTFSRSIPPGDTGGNVYARGHAAVGPSQDAATQVDNDRNVEEAEAAVLREYEIIDLTDEALSQIQPDSQGRYRYKQVARNEPLESSHRARSVYRFGNMELKPGTCVELREPFGKWEIQFVEIQSILVSKSDGSVTIRGLPYTRNRNLGGRLENKRNEVCQIIEIDANDQRSDEAQALFQISPQQILRVRILNKTNADFPRHRFGDQQWLGKTELEREKEAPLTCRWKARIQYQDARFRKRNKHDFPSILKLTESEADGRFRVSDKELTVNFRGKTHRGGSHKPQVINLDGSEAPVTRKDRQYTFADMFCGGGGTSRGAAVAELKLVFGVDRDPASCATWRLNFPGAHMYEQDATDFIHNPEINYRSHPIDILHLSPPCQFWSPYAYPHAHAGRNNEENMAILFACPEVINKIRPRLFTLEQTFGLTHNTHEEFLNSLVRGFTSHGYSVQGKIVPLVEYGLPQTRRRLILIGSCPGEPLPPWPPATHSAVPDDGLKPLVTEAQAIRNLNRRGVTLHDVANTRARDLPPRDGNMPFKKTITCGGTQGTSHYSGLRDFTLREIACLQGFPVYHQFVGNKTAIKKQIGNAFAPCVVKAFYDHLRTWLRRVDGVQSVPAQDHRGIRAPVVLPVQPQHHVNGDLDEDQALQLALQESMRENHRTIIDISDDEDSPVSAVAPLLERMSIAPSGAESDLQSRSRSVTLGRSLSPSPGPSRRARASQKRSLDSMHDGEVDTVQKEESPPKRERALEAGEHVVDDGRIPSSLPRYNAGPRDARGADDENVVVGQSRNGSMPEDRDSHQGPAGEDSPPGQSAMDWSNILFQARMAGNSGNAVWTF